MESGNRTKNNVSLCYEKNCVGVFCSDYMVDEVTLLAAAWQCLVDRTKWIQHGTVLADWRNTRTGSVLLLERWPSSCWARFFAWLVHLHLAMCFTSRKTKISWLASFRRPSNR